MSSAAETPRQELARIEREVQRRADLTDPAGWIRRRLGDHVWSKQEEICDAVRKYRRVAVKACHGPGKSFIMARLIAWWNETGKWVKSGNDDSWFFDSFAVTSAPTAPQIRAILWRELRRAHRAGKLRGRTNQVEWLEKAPGPGNEEELIAFGRKPADTDPSAFQGIHARRVLVLFDEACGIPKALWDAADGLITSEESRMVAVGNPDDPTSEFAQICKPGSGWHVITISAFDTPNFTGEWVPEQLRHLLTSVIWVEERKKKWGETNPLYISKVLGNFPENASDGIIPISWVNAAIARGREAKAAGVWGGFWPPVEGAPRPAKKAGVDVGGGGDKSTMCEIDGWFAKMVYRGSNPDTMQTLGDLLRILKARAIRRAQVDYIGIGRGLTDRGREQRAETGIEFIGVNVSLPADANDPAAKEAYLNLRAQYWWNARERFREGHVVLDPDDEDLAAQLVAVKYHADSRGHIVVQSKDDMEKSPDDADAFVLGLANPSANAWLDYAAQVVAAARARDEAGGAPQK